MLVSCGPSGPAPKPPAAFPDARASEGAGASGRPRGAGGGADAVEGKGEATAGAKGGAAVTVGEAKGGAAVTSGDEQGAASVSRADVRSAAEVPLRDVKEGSVAAAAAPAADANSVRPPPAPAGLSTAASDPAWMQCGSIEFPKPVGWKWVQPTAPFRTLQYAVPGDAELIVSVFPAGDGGAVDANVERWAKQFGGPASVKARSERVMGELRVTRVDFEGEFKGMGMAQAKAGMSQLGAIVQGPKQSVFVRVLGAKAAVEAARREFEQLVAGARPQS